MTRDEALIERIRLRCVECGDCWVWKGAAVEDKHPQIKVNGRVLSVRRALYEAMHGPVPADREVAATCETRKCVIHAEPQTHSRIGRRVAKTGVYANPVRCANLANSKRTGSRLDAEKVADIRYGGETLLAVAQRYGITEGYASRIRRNLNWKEYGSPFAGLGARS
jgi:hypothetical protein